MQTARQPAAKGELTFQICLSLLELAKEQENPSEKSRLAVIVWKFIQKFNDTQTAWIKPYPFTLAEFNGIIEFYIYHGICSNDKEHLKTLQAFIHTALKNLINHHDDHERVVYFLRPSILLHIDLENLQQSADILVDVIRMVNGAACYPFSKNDLLNMHQRVLKKLPRSYLLQLYNCILANRTNDSFVSVLRGAIKAFESDEQMLFEILALTEKSDHRPLLFAAAQEYFDHFFKEQRFGLAYLFFCIALGNGARADFIEWQKNVFAKLNFDMRFFDVLLKNIVKAAYDHTLDSLHPNILKYFHLKVFLGELLFGTANARYLDSASRLNGIFSELCERILNPDTALPFFQDNELEQKSQPLGYDGELHYQTLNISDLNPLKVCNALIAVDPDLGIFPRHMLFDALCKQLLKYRQERGKNLSSAVDTFHDYKGSNADRKAETELLANTMSEMRLPAQLPSIKYCMRHMALYQGSLTKLELKQALQMSYQKIADAAKNIVERALELAELNVNGQTSLKKLLQLQLIVVISRQEDANTNFTFKETQEEAATALAAIITKKFTAPSADKDMGDDVIRFALPRSQYLNINAREIEAAILPALQKFRFITRPGLAS